MTKIKPEERRCTFWDQICKRSHEERKGSKWIKERKGLETKQPGNPVL